MLNQIDARHPLIILRGRWVNGLSAFFSTRGPARRAKKGSET